MIHKPRPIGAGLLAAFLSVSIFVPTGIAQGLDYSISSSTKSVAAGSAGAALTAKVGSSSKTLNFSICFATGYGSTAPIVPSSFTSSGGSAYVDFSVPASTIQQVPPTAFTAGSFPASLYAVPVDATSCTGTAPTTSATIDLLYPRLSGISLVSVPQQNPNLSTRLPANLTLSGTSFLAGTAATPGTSSAVTFTASAPAGTSFAGTVHSISSTRLVSNIPTSIGASIPSVGVQVCNTTALYTYCSNTLDLTLAPLAANGGKVTAAPNPALPTQNVAVGATFGTADPSVAGAPGGLVTFADGKTVLGTALLSLDATGRFLRPPCTTFRGSSPAAFPILADFNQDGVPDVLLLDAAANTVNMVFGSSPAATFAYDREIGPPASGASILDVAVADFNGDGFPDLAILAKPKAASANTVYLLLNDGSGNFVAPIAAFTDVFATHLLAADFNHDGNADIALAGALDGGGTTGIEVLFGDGTGHLTAGPATSGLNTAPSSSFGGFEIATADFNGDGFPDIAVLNGANSGGTAISKSVAVFQNDGTGRFTAAAIVATDGTAAATFEAAPLGQHQLPALLVTSSSGVSVALNQGTASTAFSGSLSITAIPGFKKAVFGDFNGDGLLDAAVDDGSTVHVLNGDGLGGFTITHPGLSFASIAGVALFAATDVNGDTYADLMTLRENTGSDAGSYTLQGYVTTGSASASLAPTTFTVGVHNLVASTPGTFYLQGASASTALTIDIPTSVSVNTSVPSSVTYGQPVTLSATIPDATATGTVSFYTGTKLLGSATLIDTTSAIGQFTTSTLPAGNYGVKAVYSGDATHASSTSSAVSFVILQATPTLIWPTPASIIAGTSLSSAQLNATATGVTAGALPGNFTYTPPAGTVETAGSQTLKVVFTPTDLTDYTTASASVSISVVPFTVSGLSSELALLGDPAKTITISGTGFFPTAVVLMNGTPVPTSYVSSTAITAVLPASDFLKVGTLQITVLDSAQSAVSQALPFYVVAPIASVIFSGPNSIVPGTQITLTFELTNPYPVPLTATFSLGFTPASGLPNDPNVLFASGSTTDTVVIPANSTASPQVLVQTGTIAGTLTVGLDLMAGGTDVTPSSIHPLNIAAPVSAPAITSVSASGSGNTLTVTVHGFSNTRELTTANFHFTPVPGQSIGTQNVTIDVGAIFAAWYANPASDQYGSAFTYTQVFNLSSDASVVGQVTVTLANSVGTSPPVSSQ